MERAVPGVTAHPKHGVELSEFAVAMVIHVLAMVLWVGGVGMVTTVVIPIVRRLSADANTVEMSEAIQKGFAWKARFMVPIAGG